MNKIAPLIMISLLVSCTSNEKTIEQKASQFAHNITSPLDERSSLGKIEISEETISVDANTTDANEVLALVEKNISQNNVKHFFLIDLKSQDTPSATRVAVLIHKALEPLNINYDIKISTDSREFKEQNVLLSLRAVSIKPRDCSPITTNVPGRVGGYNEARFGCAFANNISAMIDNPRDVITPRGTTVAITPRTIKILRSYLEGEAAGADLPKNEAGEASEVSPSE